MSEYFLNWRPTYPWSASPIGLPALAVVAVLLITFTIWTYTGHPNATRRRILIVLALRLVALVVALLTAHAAEPWRAGGPKGPIGAPHWCGYIGVDEGSR